MEKYYNVKESQVDEKISMLLLHSMSDLDAIVTGVMSSKDIPIEARDNINKRIEATKNKISKAFDKANRMEQS